MSVIDHLRELRRRLIVVVILVVIGAVVGWYLYPHTIDFLKRPYCDVPAQYRYQVPGHPKDCVLIYNQVLGGFGARLKISVISGIIFTSPFWLYQLWAFITPGLRKNERRYTIIFILTSTLLFACGVALSFVLLYKALDTLLRLSGSGTVALLTVTDYISFVTLMLIVFGCAFELPLIIVMANFAGVLPAKLLVRTQRIGIFLVFAFAAVATPSTDPFTMLGMAIPMVILYEAAVLVAVAHDRRKARRKAAQKASELSAEQHLDDETPSRIDPVPTPLRQPSETPDRWSDTT